MTNAFMASSGQQAAQASSAGQLGGLTAAGITSTSTFPATSLGTQYAWPAQFSYPPVPPVDELIESQKWVYVRKSTDHGKKQGETAGIILVDTDGNQKRITMEELAVIAGWEW